LLSDVYKSVISYFWAQGMVRSSPLQRHLWGDTPFAISFRQIKLL